MTGVARWVAAGAIAIAAAACGDDGGKVTPDAVQVDAMDVDAPIPVTTLTSYVIDLVQNHTAGNLDARPYSEFSDLDDPDTSNPSAYDALFP